MKPALSLVLGLFGFSIAFLTASTSGFAQESMTTERTPIGCPLSKVRCRPVAQNGRRETSAYLTLSG